MVKRALLIAALLGFCGSAHAQITSNPLLFPSATLVPGDCLQATGQNTVATVAGPCGTASGTGNVNGPSSSTIGNVAVWGNATGTGIINSSIPVSSIPLLGASQMWGGVNTFTVAPIVPSLTVNGTGAVNGINVATPAGTFKALSFNTAGTGLQRWLIGSNADAETGSNAGSNFNLFSYSDAGATLRNNLTINRATGAMSWFARPTFAGNLAWDAGNLPNPFTTAGGTLTGALTVPGSVTVNPASNTSTLALGYGASGLFYDFTATGTGTPNAVVALRDRLLGFSFFNCTSATGKCDFSALTIDGDTIITAPVLAQQGFLTQTLAASTYLTKADAATTYVSMTLIGAPAYFPLAIIPAAQVTQIGNIQGVVVPRGVKFAAGMVGSFAFVDVTSTSAMSYTVNLNGTAVADLLFPANSHAGTFSVHGSAGAPSPVGGDRLDLNFVGGTPGSFAGVHITLVGTYN